MTGRRVLSTPSPRWLTPDQLCVQDTLSDDLLFT
jgi:hypothetical protein